MNAAPAVVAAALEATGDRATKDPTFAAEVDVDVMAAYAAVALGAVGNPNASTRLGKATTNPAIANNCAPLVCGLGLDCICWAPKKLEVAGRGILWQSLALFLGLNRVPLSEDVPPRPHGQSPQNA